jgi:hypothetical protein
MLQQAYLLGILQRTHNAIAAVAGLLLLLQVLHLTKQHAYFPEQRRMAESSIAVPLSADVAARLAAGCRKLRALRLCLGSSDVTAAGLAQLSQLSSLRR